MSVCHKAWCFEHWMTCKADAQSWPSLGSPHLNSSLLHWALNFSTRRLNIHRPILMLWNAIVKCLALLHRVQEVLDCNLSPHRGKSPNTGRFPNMGRCIISYQEVLHSLLKNVNDQAHEAVLCNKSINGQLLRTSVLTGRLCFGALWDFCLLRNCDSWAVEGKLFFWISLVLSSLLSAILNSSFVS